MMDVDERAYSSSEPFAAITRTGVSVYITGIVHLTVYNAEGQSLCSGMHVIRVHSKNMCTIMTLRKWSEKRFLISVCDSEWCVRDYSIGVTI